MAQVTYLVGAGSDCQYPTLQAAWAAIPDNTVASGNSYRLELDKTAVHIMGTSMLLLSGKITDASHNIWIGPRAGHGFGDNPNVLTNAYTYNEANGVALKGIGNYYSALGIDNNYVTISGLQIYHAGGGNNGYAISFGSNLVGLVLENLIVKMNPSGTYVNAITNGDNNDLKLRNILIILDNSNSNGIAPGNSPMTIENVTVVRPSTFGFNPARFGFVSYQQYGTTLKNCLVIGSSFISDGIGFIGSNNGSDSTIAYGVNNKENLVASDLFVNPLNDFRTKIGAAIIDAGTAPSSDNTTAPNGIRQQGTSTDIGAWEYPNAIQAPSANITAVNVSGQTVTVYGTTTGSPTSGSMSLIPASVSGNNAVGKGPTAITFDSGTFTAQFTGVIVGRYDTNYTVSNSSYPNINGANSYGVIDVVGALATSVVQDPIDGQILTIHGTTSGNPTSGLVTIPAAATNPNGAITQQKSVTLGSGNFTVSVTLPPGNYDGGILTFTTDAGTSMPQSGTQAVSIISMSGNPVVPGSETPPPTATVTGVVVSPSNASGSTQFSAVVSGTNNPSQSITWSVTGGGTIDSNGNFVAPAQTASVQNITVKAASTIDPTKFDTATVTIAAGAPATVTSVSVSPNTTTGSTQFSAVVNGTNNPAQTVTWSVTGGGTIGSNGNFVAPAQTSSVQNITVKATSTVDPTKFGTATVTIAATAPGPVADRVVILVNGRLRIKH